MVMRTNQEESIYTVVPSTNLILKSIGLFSAKEEQDVAMNLIVCYLNQFCHCQVLNRAAKKQILVFCQPIAREHVHLPENTAELTELLFAQILIS